MHRRLQFDMRENPASDRRHGSRLEVASISNESRTENQSAPSAELMQFHIYAPIGAPRSANAAPPLAATGEKSCDGHLLTIREVAELLKVPISWVYGRTRKRSVERLPGIRLGKYWRFREKEIHAWVESQRGGHRAP
jgi:excisionase family DNA binding protein